MHEACNPEEIEFSPEPLQQAWAQCRPKSAGESLDLLFDRLQSFLADASPHDDITAVVLKAAS